MISASKQSNFDACLREVLRYEGGFVNHPKDPGGATNRGITRATLEAFRGRKVTLAEIKALSVEEAAKIYHRDYWQPIKGDDLPTGLDLCVFDCAVNSGSKRAMTFLRQAYKEALSKTDVTLLINVYSRKRLTFLMGLSTWPYFGRGWYARVKAVEKIAMKMMELATNHKPLDT